jgi:hypothetical protein
MKAIGRIGRIARCAGCMFCDNVERPHAVLDALEELDA